MWLTFVNMRYRNNCKYMTENIATERLGDLKRVLEVLHVLYNAE